MYPLFACGCFEPEEEREEVLLLVEPIVNQENSIESADSAAAFSGYGGKGTNLSLPNTCLKYDSNAPPA
jgi:hypothetical protein